MLILMPLATNGSLCKNSFYLIKSTRKINYKRVGTVLPLPVCVTSSHIFPGNIFSMEKTKNRSAREQQTVFSGKNNANIKARSRKEGLYHVRVIPA